MALLTGIQVVELATVLAGPAVGQFLAELGATVIKIEPPTGDITRTWRLPSEPTETGTSAYYSAVNWGKQVRTLDLKQPDQRHILYQLTDAADIVIANYRPGDDVKLGADAPTLRARNPGLIYAHLTGYGATDQRPGYDAVVQAEAGFQYLNGPPDGAPTKMPVALMDLLAAHHLKAALLCALYQRERTGQGCTVHVPLLAAGLTSLANQASAWLWAGQNPVRQGSEHPSIVPYGTVFHDQHGKPLILAVGSDRQFADLCAVLHLAHLPTDVRFATNPARVQHRTELLPQLQTAIAWYDRAVLLEQLAQMGVPAAAVNNVAEALALPEAQHLLLRDATGKPKGIRTVAFDDPGDWLAYGLLQPANSTAMRR